MSSGPVPEIESKVQSSADDEHLKTDHLLHNIGRRAVSGGFVTFAAQLVKFVLTFGAAAILARLLSPRDFGLVGMVLGVTALVEIFNELGLSMATVQRQSITNQQVSNLFWINVAVSGFFSVVTCAFAPLLARFYQDTRITLIVLALAPLFLLTGSTVQHRALLARQMRFRAIAVIDVTSMLLGFLAACALARAGFGYWALVAQQQVFTIASLVLTWSTSRWRPEWPSSGSGVRPLLSFGAHLTLADSVARLTVNSDSVLVGKFFGAASLGLYSRASVLLRRPLDQVFAPVSAVMDPVLARLQSDPARYRQTFLRTYDMMAMIILPFSAVCLALSRPLVLVILGPKWDAAIPMFAAFAVVAISSPLANIVSWLYQSQGRGRDQLRSHTIGGIITVAAYVVGLKWGPVGVVVAQAITCALVRLPVVYYIAGRSGPVSTSDLFFRYCSQLPAWATVYLSTMLVRMAFGISSPLLEVLVCAPLGLLAGGVLLVPFRRPRESALYAFNTLKNTLVQQLGRA